MKIRLVPKNKSYNNNIKNNCKYDFVLCHWNIDTVSVIKDYSSPTTRFLLFFLEIDSDQARSSWTLRRHGNEIAEMLLPFHLQETSETTIEFRCFGIIPLQMLSRKWKLDSLFKRDQQKCNKIRLKVTRYIPKYFYCNIFV